MNESETINLRPHHGMCLAYFEGKGYSEEFVLHMQEMLDQLTKTDALIRLVTKTDEICTACPNNKDGVCDEKQKVAGYDTKVLELCQLREGQILPFRTFTELVQGNILSPGRMSQVCAGCKWEEICKNRKSRWT